MANRVLLAVEGIADVPTQFAYSTTAIVFEVANGDYKVHFIWETANYSAGNFANAPNGSMVFAQADSKVYQKSGALGKIDGTLNALN